MDLICKHNINVFINRQLIYNYPEQLFADKGVMAIEHADFEGVERLAAVLGAEICSTFDRPDLVPGRCRIPRRAPGGGFHGAASARVERELSRRFLGARRGAASTTLPRSAPRDFASCHVERRRSRSTPPPGQAGHVRSY